MATCPECSKELVKTESKKKGMFVLKHKEGERGECGVTFIPVDTRKKGAVTDGGKGQRTEGGEYAEAVAAAASSGGPKGKSKQRSGGKQRAAEPAGQQQRREAPDSGSGKSGDSSLGGYLKKHFGF